MDLYTKSVSKMQVYYDALKIFYTWYKGSVHDPSRMVEILGTYYSVSTIYSNPDINIKVLLDKYTL